MKAHFHMVFYIMERRCCDRGYEYPFKESLVWSGCQTVFHPVSESSSQLVMDAVFLILNQRTDYMNLHVFIACHQTQNEP